MPSVVRSVMILNNFANYRRLRAYNIRISYRIWETWPNYDPRVETDDRHFIHVRRDFGVPLSSFSNLWSNFWPRYSLPVSMNTQSAFMMDKMRRISQRLGPGLFSRNRNRFEQIMWYDWWIGLFIPGQSGMRIRFWFLSIDHWLSNLRSTGWKVAIFSLRVACDLSLCFTYTRYVRLLCNCGWSIRFKMQSSWVLLSIHIGRLTDSVYVPLMMNCAPIQWMHSVRYLGVHICG